MVQEGVYTAEELEEMRLVDLPYLPVLEPVYYGERRDWL